MTEEVHFMKVPVFSCQTCKNVEDVYDRKVAKCPWCGKELLRLLVPACKTNGYTDHLVFEEKAQDG